MNDLPYNTFSTFGGIQVIEGVNMTVAGELYEVSRTWKDRVFTWPWNPLRKTYTIIPQVPSDEIIRFKDKMVCHPTIANKLRQELRNY